MTLPRLLTQKTSLENPLRASSRSDAYALDALIVEEPCNCSWFPCVLELMDIRVADILAGVHINVARVHPCALRARWVLVTVLGARAAI